jgi:hypothetical protein
LPSLCPRLPTTTPPSNQQQQQQQPDQQKTTTAPTTTTTVTSSLFQVRSCCQESLQQTHLQSYKSTPADAQPKQNTSNNNNNTNDHNHGLKRSQPDNVFFAGCNRALWLFLWLALASLVARDISLA